MGLLLLQGASDLNPRELFANGEQGLWLDPSQMSTLYQDSNGVTPCTAAGDPVGLILDQSRGGLGALGSELITNGTFNTDLTGWTLSQTAGATLPAYDAGAIKLVSDGSGFSRADQSFTTVIGATYFLEFSFTYPGAGAGVVKVGTTASNGSEVSVSESTSGNKKYRFVAAATTTWIRLETGSNNATGYKFDNVTVRLVPGNHAYQTTSASRPTLQTSGGLWYLSFDGSDDSLVTNSVDFSGTDEMTVITGVRKLSDAATAMLVEMSSNVFSNNGSFNIYSTTSKRWSITSVGTIAGAADGALDSSVAPVTNVLAASFDISNDLISVRQNGSLLVTGNQDQGSGNYGNYQLFIGRRNQASLPFNGHIYQLIVRGRTTPTGKLLEAERFTARKTGVSF